MAKHDHLHTLDINTQYPEKLWRAMNRAAHAHEDQKRKNVDEWYISHPFRVMEYTMLVTNDTDVHCAAMLHDTVEDTTMTIEDIIDEYGEDVAFYVWGVTKDDTFPTWRGRNEAYLDRLENEAHDNSVIIALADKIANIEDTMRDYAEHGEAVWANFSAGPEDQLWWYTSVLELAKRRLVMNPLIEILEQRIEDFKGQVLGAESPLSQ